MGIAVIGLSFDSPDAAAIANFWAQVLGRQVSDGASGDFAAIGADDVATSGPFLMFHKVPEGKTVKNRLHLDLSSKEFEAESARLLGLGATRVTDVTGDEGKISWTTFADPDGNEFDLVNG